MISKFKRHLCEIVRVQTSERRDLENGLRLDRNERVVNFPPEALKEIFASLPAWSLCAYPNCAKFTAKLAAWLGLKPEEAYVFNGVTEGIRILFETLSSPGDFICLPSHTYPMYSVYAKIFQVSERPYNMLEVGPGEFAPDFAAIERGLDDNPAFVVLVNPNVPVESYVCLDKVASLAKACSQRGIPLVVDEAYWLFGTESASKLIADFDNIIVLQSFSKAFGLAGMRLGHMLSQSRNIEYLAKTRSITETNAISMHVVSYMLDNDWLMRRYADEVRDGAERLKARLDALGFSHMGGRYSNSLMVFPPEGMEGTALAEHLASLKIYVRQGFAAPYGNCVRVTVGPPAQMDALADGIASFLASSSAKA